MNAVAGKQFHQPPKIGWLRRWRINRMLDMPEKEAAPKLAKFGPSALPVLLEALERGDLRSAKAAYLIGKLAENDVDCREAVMPLYELLLDGNDLEKGNAAVALARIWNREALSMLVAALHDKNCITRRFAAVGLGLAGDVFGEAALKKAAESDPDQRVRELAHNALRQIVEMQG